MPMFHRSPAVSAKVETFRWLPTPSRTPSISIHWMCFSPLPPTPNGWDLVKASKHQTLQLLMLSGKPKKCRTVIITQKLECCTPHFHSKSMKLEEWIPKPKMVCYVHIMGPFFPIHSPGSVLEDPGVGRPHPPSRTPLNT